MANLPKIALGAWAWGNDGTFGNNLTAESLKPIFDTAMENGLNLWDTAYAYGMGTSEKVLAGFLKGLPRESYLISDKFTPQAADYSSNTAMADMIEMQLNLMELFVTSSYTTSSGCAERNYGLSAEIIAFKEGLYDSWRNSPPDRESDDHLVVRIHV